MTRDNAVTDAHRALERAEQKIHDAEQARDEAHDRLDAALADAGWTRLVGAFTPDATVYYTSPLYPSATLELPQVLDLLARQGRAAA